MISKDFLESIINSDSDNLIDKAPKSTKAESKKIIDTAGKREKEVFDWIEAHGREPSATSKDITEQMFATRLSIMKQKKNCSKENSEEENPLKSPLLEDMISQLNRNKSILDFTDSVLSKPSEKPRNNSDFVAKRTPIKNFSQTYEPIFKQVQKEIDAKVRKLIPFSASAMHVGDYFIAGGILCYIDDMYDKKISSFGRYDYRLHVIFANGTESFMLFSTFAKIMCNENGRSVTGLQDNPEDFELTPEDIKTGIIYILRSASDDETVTQFGKDLYKVGYTSTTVKERIKNAINEPTYLCAPVIIMEQWKCNNINARALETFLHKFFVDAQKKIQVNHNGKLQIATEWYNVPLKVLEKVVPLIISEEIVNYRYDSNYKDIFKK